MPASPASPAGRAYADASGRMYGEPCPSCCAPVEPPSNCGCADYSDCNLGCTGTCFHITISTPGVPCRYYGFVAGVGNLWESSIGREQILYDGDGNPYLYAEPEGGVDFEGDVSISGCSYPALAEAPRMALWRDSGCTNYYNGESRGFWYVLIRSGGAWHTQIGSATDWLGRPWFEGSTTTADCVHGFSIADPASDGSYTAAPCTESPPP